jgi:hypothetical protein
LGGRSELPLTQALFGTDYIENSIAHCTTTTLAPNCRRLFFFSFLFFSFLSFSF